MSRLAALALVLFLAACGQAPVLGPGLTTPAVEGGPAEAPDAGALLTGSGFFVTDRGHLVTAYHVVRERDQVRVRLHDSQRALTAAVLKRDARMDLALLKVEAVTRPLALADWEAVPMGLEAYVLGYPLPGLQGGSVKITGGIVNGEAGLRRERRLFQFSAQVQTGNSGGPVLSPDGLVMGVVQSKLDALGVAQKLRDLPQNVNFAVNARVLLDFLSDTGIQAQVRVPRLEHTLRPYQLLRQTVDSVAMVVSRESRAEASGAVPP